MVFPAQSQAKGGRAKKKGYKEILVRFRPGVSEERVRQIHAAHEATPLSVHGPGKRPRRGKGPSEKRHRRVRASASKSVDELIRAYNQEPEVLYAEPNLRVRAYFVPDDTFYTFQWHLHDAPGGIQMESAWDIQRGNPSVVIAVVDTGVAYENFGSFTQAPDLANTLFVPGFDFVNNDSHPNDDDGHGTHVTGTLAQSTNNGLGLAGIAHQSSIMPIKVLDQNGQGFVSDVADGIYFAADNGADVINLSLGADGFSQTLFDAVQYAYQKGVTVVCAAGNDSSTNLGSPAGFDDYCIAVGATRFDETQAWYSNFGPSLDIVAPGGDLSVDQNGDGYADGVLQQTFVGKNTNTFDYWFFEGTSMATPHVAGTAALLISNGLTGPAAVREALEQTAKDLGAAGRDDTYGHGLLDAYAALLYAPQLVHDLAVTDVSVVPTALKGDTVEIQVSLSNLGDFSEDAEVTIEDTTEGSAIGTASATLPAGGQATVTIPWDTTSASLGAHVLEATVSAVSGETDTDNNALTTTVTLLEPTHDVALLSLDVPASANIGDTVPVSVLVENQGTFAESGLTVTLIDTNTGNTINSQSVAMLEVGLSTTVSFDWDTTGAVPGDHILEAEVSEVSDETDTADNRLTADVSLVQGITGEGFILSRDPDFSTDDREYAQSDTVFMKLFTDSIDPATVRKAQWEVKVAGVRLKGNLTNNGDGTYTASQSLGQFSPGDAGTVKLKVEGPTKNDKVKFRNIPISIVQ
jgi:serine protease